MRRLLVALFCSLLLAAPVRAQDMPMMPKQDDRVMFDIAAEDWVTTKTARVTVNVEAAVSGNTAGTMRADMMKAVNDLAKGDWRLTSFNRSQDQTGLERWSASFEARLAEADLGGIHDAAKKVSKAGMQLTIADVDFSPTLEETEAVRSALRVKLYKNVNDQLAALNAAMPGRNYRIAMVSFGGNEGGPLRAPMMKTMAYATDGAMAAPMAAPVERAEKVTLAARVVFAAATPDKH